MIKGAAKSRKQVMPRFTIIPDNPPRVIWDVFVVFLVFYQAVVLPFELCFQVELGLALTIIDRLTDAAFWFDIILNFFTTYAEKGVYVTDRKKWIRRYLKGWFTLDLLATFPFEVFSAFVPENQKFALSIFKGFKCFRLLRLSRLLRLLQKFQALNQIMSFLRLFFSFFLFSHWFACLWFLVGSQYDKETNWLTAESIDWDNDPLVDTYVSSVYWVVTTLLTVGYGDISPNNDVEKIFAMFTMVIGAAFYATIFGKVSQLMDKLNSKQKTFSSKMEEVNNYMKDLELPQEVQKRVNRYYNFLWARNKKFDDSSPISEVPQSLMEEITTFLHSDLIGRCTVLQGAPTLLIRRFSAKFAFCVSLPDDEIIKDNDTGEKVYFLRKGSVKVVVEGRSGRKTIVTELERGSYFGEVAMFHENRRRTASVFALENCDMYSIADNDFAEIMFDFADYEMLFFLIAQERLRQKSMHNDEILLEKVFRKQVAKGELKLGNARKQAEQKKRRNTLAQSPSSPQGRGRSPSVVGSGRRLSTFTPGGRRRSVMGARSPQSRSPNFNFKRSMSIRNIDLGLAALDEEKQELRFSTDDEEDETNEGSEDTDDSDETGSSGGSGNDTDKNGSGDEKEDNTDSSGAGSKGSLEGVESVDSGRGLDIGLMVKVESSTDVSEASSLGKDKKRGKRKKDKKAKKKNGRHNAGKSAGATPSGHTVVVEEDSKARDRIPPENTGVSPSGHSGDVHSAVFRDRATSVYTAGFGVFGRPNSPTQPASPHSPSGSRTLLTASPLQTVLHGEQPNSGGAVDIDEVLLLEQQLLAANHANTLSPKERRSPVASMGAMVRSGSVFGLESTATPSAAPRPAPSPALATETPGKMTNGPPQVPATILEAAKTEMSGSRWSYRSSARKKKPRGAGSLVTPPEGTTPALTPPGGHLLNAAPHPRSLQQLPSATARRTPPPANVLSNINRAANGALAPRTLSLAMLESNARPHTVAAVPRFNRLGSVEDLLAGTPVSEVFGAGPRPVPQLSRTRLSGAGDFTAPTKAKTSRKKKPTRSSSVKNSVADSEVSRDSSSQEDISAEHARARAQRRERMRARSAKKSRTPSPKGLADSRLSPATLSISGKQRLRYSRKAPQRSAPSPLVVGANVVPSASGAVKSRYGSTSIPPPLSSSHPPPIPPPLSTTSHPPPIPPAAIQVNSGTALPSPIGGVTPAPGTVSPVLQATGNGGFALPANLTRIRWGKSKKKKKKKSPSPKQ